MQQIQNQTGVKALFLLEQVLDCFTGETWQVPSLLLFQEKNGLLDLSMEAGISRQIQPVQGSRVKDHSTSQTWDCLPVTIMAIPSIRSLLLIPWIQKWRFLPPIKVQVLLLQGNCLFPQSFFSRNWEWMDPGLGFGDWCWLVIGINPVDSNRWCQRQWIIWIHWHQWHQKIEGRPWKNDQPPFCNSRNCSFPYWIQLLIA